MSYSEFTPKPDISEDIAFIQGARLERSRIITGIEQFARDAHRAGEYILSGSLMRLVDSIKLSPIVKRK